MTASRSRWPLALATVALLASACGSTVQQSAGGALSGGGTAAGPGSQGLGAAPGTAGAGGGPGGSSALGSGTTGGGAAGSAGSLVSGGGTGSGGSSGAAGGAGGTAAGSSGSSGTTAAGSSGGVIKLGYIYSSDQSAVGNSLGIKGIVAGDTGKQFAAIAKAINDSGGVLGRKIVLYGHDESTANEIKNPSDEENKACTDFVQDHPVFAVLSSGIFLSPCLAQHDIISIGQGNIQDPATINSQLIFDGGGMLINVLAKAFVERLVAETYFTGWNTALGRPGAAPVKVGLIYQDIPLYRHYYADVKEVFKAHGITVDPHDEFLYAPTADSVASQSQAAVLRFSSDGVTHVFGAALLFFKAADNQNYHPRYALDSQVPPSLLAQNVGASQLRGSLGIGWRPTQDVDQAQDPGPVSPLATKCTKIMQAAGEDLSSRTVVYLTHIECEQMWSIAAAIVKAGTISVSAVIAGFGALGRVTPTLTFGERWAPDRRASNTTVADLGYNEKCSCFMYTTARTSF